MPGNVYSASISAFCLWITENHLARSGARVEQPCHGETVGWASDPAAASPGAVRVDLALVFQLGERALHGTLSEAASACERGARPGLAAAKEREQERSFPVARRDEHDDALTT